MKLCSPPVGSLLVLGLLFSWHSAGAARAEDQPQWGERFSRNMVSQETRMPESFDPESGKNIKWSAPLGTRGYGTATVANGRVFVGANNAEPRDPRHDGDRGVLLALDEADGSLCWQLVTPRVDPDDRYKDWPLISMCSPPTIEGDRIYTVTSRYEVVCLDLDGQADGNDGPYLDEGRYMVPDGEPAMQVTAIDADIVWLLDMQTDVGMYPHDSAHASILLDGQYLYLNTCNGVDNTHKVIRRPNAPSLIVVDKQTGRLVAKDDEHIGPRIYHSTWSSPAMGTPNDRKLAFFAGGDGVCYAFEALMPSSVPESVQTLKRVWRFDCDPTGPKEDLHLYKRNLKVSPSGIMSMPVFHDNRLYVSGGGDIWWGKEEAWLKCIDATGTGEITATGELWSYPLERHCCSTPAIYEGMAFVADCGGKLHCVDITTGKPYWTHELARDVWASPLVADGKVYIGSRAGDFWILAAEKEKCVLASVEFDAGIATSATAANGVLYVATLERLYAIQADGKD